MEEDIEILQRLVDEKELTGIYKTDGIVLQAIENLIHRNKELKEENLKLHTEIAEVVYWESSSVEQIKQDYIPKSKVREIIQDIDNSQPVIAELKLRKLVEGDK